MITIIKEMFKFLLFIKKNLEVVENTKKLINILPYKLSYFNFRGRGEPIRLLFHFIGVEFENFQIQRKDWISLYKNSKLNFMIVIKFKIFFEYFRYSIRSYSCS